MEITPLDYQLALLIGFSRNDWGIYYNSSSPAFAFILTKIAFNTLKNQTDPPKS